LLRYLVRRSTWAAFTLWAISLVSFLVIQLPPGDFASEYYARLADSGISPPKLEQIRKNLGLDESAPLQYWHWLTGMLHGDFGQSLSMQEPVSRIIAGAAGYTVLIAGLSIVTTWFVAVPLGVYSAVRRYSFLDYVITCIGFIGLGVPTFLLALALMYFAFQWFGVNLGGLFSPEYLTAPWSMGRVLNMLEHLIIPSIVLAVGGIAYLHRVMRANLLDELGKPYVVTAQAKGLSRWRLITKYPVRVALNPFASSIGLLLREAMSDTIIISVVLALPTLGPILLTSLRAQDMLLAGAIIMLLGVITVVGTFISDLILMALDPRIRHAG
jgi:peptide/nickel transport system permease protein